MREFTIVSRVASGDFLGQRDDDAGRASHIAESILVPVLDHLADELGAAGMQARHDVVNVFDRKHDLPKAQSVWRGVHWLSLDQIRIAELRQLNPPVAVRSPHHGDVGLHACKPAKAINRRPLDRHLPLKRQAEGSEEVDGSREVVNDDADVIHSINRHMASIGAAVRARRKLDVTPADPRVIGRRKRVQQNFGTAT